MSNSTSNRNADYLKFHVELETEGACLPYRQLPEYKAFESRWQVVANCLKESGYGEPTSHERNIAENWFMWGYSTARLIP